LIYIIVLHLSGGSILSPLAVTPHLEIFRDLRGHVEINAIAVSVTPAPPPIDRYWRGRFPRSLNGGLIGIIVERGFNTYSVKGGSYSRCR